MSENSAIEWTDHTFNPWWGCTKVSTGCKHCYAEGMARRFGGDIWGPGRSRRTFGDATWQKPLAWNRRAAESDMRSRVFCASMADVFDETGPDSERARLWDLIDATPALDWQVLTKRPESVMDMIPARWRTALPTNVWLGVSVESPEYYDRAAILSQIPACVRFLSVEPLLERVPDLPLSGIYWVIVGGESGPKSRPMSADWVREVRDTCAREGVAFFFKQWGGRNKKAAGRDLDGRIHDALPIVGSAQEARARA